jgi:8-oxo-dGTP pyrophosphatase MutT (NUDIX family)
MARRLAAFERLAVPDNGKPRAAVAIVVSPTAQGAAFILTKRARHLRRNPGNYALPGGHVDPGETIEAAAIRETWEELGVTLESDAALGLLDDFETLTGRIVTPVVLWSAHALALRPNPEEVGEAWLLPIAELDEPGSPRFVDDPTGGPPILQMRIRGKWINAPTAAWLYQFRELAVHGRLVRVSEVGQPGWTAR